MNTTRRAALQGGAAAGLAALALPSIARAAAGSVVVIGAGFGGATAARYLKTASPALDVTLVERDTSILTCPFSNGVIAGYNTMADITRSLDGVRAAGVKLVTGEATAIDTQPGRSAERPHAARLRPVGGLARHRAQLRSACPATARPRPRSCRMPGRPGRRRLLLRSQLEAMPDGGTFIIVAPANPFRCPPGPYERVSLIASYFKTQKPKSKILVLDAKDAFSKQGLFQAAWESEYPGMIAWIAGKDGGKVEKVDAQAMTVTSGFGTEKGDVINVIPPQRAGRIAIDAGLRPTIGWCAVDPMTFASPKAQHVYVDRRRVDRRRDAEIRLVGQYPGQGRGGRHHRQPRRQAHRPPALFNICYSLVNPNYGISVADVYQVTPDKGIVPTPNAGGVSVAKPTSLNERALEALYAVAWYRNISADTWG